MADKVTLTAKLEGKTLAIWIDTTSPVPSTSGKTLLVASTHGDYLCEDVIVDGKPLHISFNAYISNVVKKTKKVK